MKILYLNVVVDYSSTGRLVRDLAEGAKREGHQVKIIYGRKSAKKESDSIKIAHPLETSWHGLMTKMLGRHGLHSKKSTKEVIKQIDQFAPDLVHLHNLHGYYLHVPMLLSYLENKDIPIVWTVHDFWLISGSSAYFHYYGCDYWDDGCVINKKPSLYPGSLFYKRQQKNFKWKKKVLTRMKNVDYVTVSNWQKEELKKSFLKDKNIQTIYNGLDLDLFHKKDKIEKTESLNLLAVANDWKESKGLYDLEKISQLLKEDEHLSIIGLSEKQIKEFPLVNDRIKLQSRTQDLNELVEKYQEADVYLNLSYEETMGMTTAEALACGTPCVTYNQTAVPEMINEEVGIVVEAGDIKGALKAARKIKNRAIDPDICREYAENKFDRNEMIRRYLSLYQQKIERE